jgi:hypothetical protein
MAHISYAPDYLSNSKLFKNIKAIHDADVAGTGSVITIYLTEQEIDLDDDEALVDDADAAHVLGQSLAKDSEDLFEKRDIIIEYAFKNHRALVQYLKGLKRGKVHELGEWGQTVNGVDRIDYPTNPLELINCIKLFIEKHNTFPPGASPIKPYLDAHTDIDLAQTLLDLGTAVTHHNDADQAAKDSEEQYELRDTKFETVYQHILGIGQYLINTYDTNPHHLGRWGFVIDNANPKEVNRLLTIKQSSVQTVYNAVQGSMVINKGNVSVKLYPGKNTTATPIVLAPNAVFTIKFRYGTFTVQNEDPSQSTDLSATTYHN